MYWGMHHAIPPLRPWYAASGALATAFCAAHILLLFDINNILWNEYIQFLRLLSWVVICAPPIVGTRWVQYRSDDIDKITTKVQEGTP